MKKLWCLTVVAVMLLITLTGCKGDDNQETTTLSASEETSVFSEVTSENLQSAEMTSAEVQSQTVPSETENLSEVTTVVSPEATTLKPEVTTAAQENTEEKPADDVTASEKETVAAVPAQNEYDILRSGTFHITGTMVESSGIDSPLEIAVTPSSVYMLSEFEGLDMGMLIYDDKLYMIYPAKQAYMEMDDSVMSMAGLSIEELMGDENVDFSSFGSLDEAVDITEEKIKGVTCSVYHIKDDEGMLRVYMNGNKIMRFASYTDSGRFITATDIDTISPVVPEGKDAPPAGYKCYKGIIGMMTFMSFFTDMM